MADRVACIACPAEAAAEMHDEGSPTLDDPGDNASQVPLDEDLCRAIDRERDLLDAIPLLGTPVDEAERRRAWTALPLRVHRRTADALTVWTPVSNCSGTGFARCSGSSRVHPGMPPLPM